MKKENIEPTAHEENLYDATKESPKNKLKEEISKIISTDLANFLYNPKSSDNVWKLDKLADQILALFEGEKKKWAEEREKTIDKIEKLSGKVFGRIPIKGVIKDKKIVWK